MLQNKICKRYASRVLVLFKWKITSTRKQNNELDGSVNVSRRTFSVFLHLFVLSPLNFWLCILRLDSSRQSWRSRNGYRCSKQLSKHSLLLPQPVHPTRQDLLKMKMMKMTSELFQAEFWSLQKNSCPTQQNKWNECLPITFVCILDRPLVF